MRVAIVLLLLGPLLAFAAGLGLGPTWPGLLALAAWEGGCVILVWRWHARRLRERAELAALLTEERNPTRTDSLTNAPTLPEAAAVALRRARRERDEAAADLVRAHIQLLSQHELLQGMTSATSAAEMADAVLRHCMRRFGALEAACFMREHDGRIRSRGLRLTAAGEQVEERVCSAPGRGGLATVLQEGRALQIGDAVRHPFLEEGQAGSLAGHPAAAGPYIAVPLTRAIAIAGLSGQSTVAGALWLRPADDRWPPSGDWREMLEAVGRTACALLDNAELYTRLEAERALRDGILNSLTAGLIAFDGAGEVRFSNRAALTMLGCGPARAERLTPYEFVPELRMAGSPLAAVAAGEQDLAVVETALPREGRDPLMVRLTLAALPPGPGERHGLLCVFDDLTRVRAMQDQIRQLDKLAAIGRFTSSVAHEVRNPLAGIAAGIDYLRRDNQLSAEHLAYIQIISQEIDRLDRVIRNLFTVARPGYLMFRRCSLEPVLERVLDLLAPAAAARDVSFTVEHRREWRDVECDPDQIQQVLLNLIKNAIEAENPGAAVHIRVDQGGYDAFGRRSTEVSPPPGLILSVENGGQGIPPEDHERIFEPFHTRKSDGTGLGLFVSYNIVKQHGGAIEVESGAAGPTRFSVYLPFQQPRSAEAP